MHRFACLKNRRNIFVNRNFKKNVFKNNVLRKIYVNSG